MQKLSDQVQQELDHVMNDLRQCTPGSLKGLVLEPLALRLLSASNRLFSITQLGSKTGGLQLKETLSLGPLRVIDDMKSEDTFMAAITREKDKGDEGVLLVPRPGFAVVDAVAIVGTGDGRHCLFVQVTVAVKHPVTGPVATRVLDKLIDRAGGSDKCALVYALPNNSTFSLFQIQTVPKLAAGVRQYKIALVPEPADEMASKLRKTK